jgi:hypothetical protein
MKITREDAYDIPNWRVPEFIVREILFFLAVLWIRNWEALIAMAVISTVVSVLTVLVMT